MAKKQTTEEAIKKINRMLDVRHSTTTRMVAISTIGDAVLVLLHDGRPISADILIALLESDESIRSVTGAQREELERKAAISMILQSQAGKPSQS